MEQLKVGKQIKNTNDCTYTVLAAKGERALLVGGWDYVVIGDLSYFESSGSWGGGEYFPFFTDEGSAEALDRALYYFINYDYKRAD